MNKGALSRSEGTWLTDASTGARIRQLTSHPAISHPTYFLQSPFLPGDRDLFFISYRTGCAQIFRAAYPDGPLLQLTDAEPVHPYSPALHPGGEEIVFTRGGAICALRLSDLAERVIVDAGGQLGEPSISPNGEWLVAAYNIRGHKGILVASICGSEWHSIPFCRTVIHPQFHPLDADWIEFAADPAPRMYRVRIDGSGLECLYDHGNDEFIVHETFLGITGDLVFTVWPKRVCRLNWQTRETSVVAEYNAWHLAPNRAGTTVLCDTNHPDEGLQLIDVRTGTRRQVCRSDASNRGTQWRRARYAVDADFVAARGGARGSQQQSLSWMESAGDSVYGPQWTHPHPSWSRDETKVAFASDRTGTTQVYVVEGVQ